MEKKHADQSGGGRGSNGVGGEVAGDDAATDKIDYVAKFLSELRDRIGKIDFVLTELGRRLPGLPPTSRRACLFGISAQLQAMAAAIQTANEIVVEHTAALTLHIANR